MPENFSNNYATTLNGAIDNAVTSLVVTSSVGRPDPNFRIIIDSEILLVTAVAGTTYTVTRGVEGTTAAAHSNGAAVTHILTAEGLRLAVTDGWTEIIKTSDQTVSNNATPQNDSTLAFSLVSGGKYIVEFHIFYSANNATGDYRWRFTYPTLTAASNAQGGGFTINASDAATTFVSLGSTTQWPSADQTAGGDTGNTVRAFFGRMMIYNTGSTGNFQFQFANASAAAGRDSTTRSGSILRYRRVE